jgi:hypothetical protein
MRCARTMRALARRVVDHRSQRIEAPVEARQAGGQVRQQRHGAGHRVQVPEECAAGEREVQLQPGPPGERPARPAQVEARQRQDHAGPRPAMPVTGLPVSRGSNSQRCMLSTNSKKASPFGSGSRSAVQGSTSRASPWRWPSGGAKLTRAGRPGSAIHGERDDPALRMRRLHAVPPAPRAAAPPHPARVGHMAQFGIDRVDDLGAKGKHGTGQPDHHEHGPGRDADEPVDLEPDAPQESHVRDRS